MLEINGKRNLDLKWGYSMYPDKTHIFFHSTRSGGVTMKDILARQYDNIFDIKQFKDYDNCRYELEYCSQEFQEKIELIQGHQYFGIHKQLSQDCVYFTLLRHPVERVISAYQSFRKTKDSPNHWWAKKYTLRRVIAKHRGFWEFNNYYTRILANIRPDEVKYGEIENKHYQQAKNNLKEHFLFAPSEKFDEMLVYLHHKLKWRKSPYYSRANTVKRKDRIEVDEETKKMIRRLNHYDLELYYYAKSEFEEKIKEVPDFEARVCYLQQGNYMRKVFFTGKRIKRKIERMM